VDVVYIVRMTNKVNVVNIEELPAATT